MEVGGTWKNSGDSLRGQRECPGKGRLGAASESLFPRRGDQMGPIQSECLNFYLNMFKPSPADENASKAERDAGEDEEDEGARRHEYEVVQLQLQQSWGCLLQDKQCFDQLYIFSEMTKY